MDDISPREHSIRRKQGLRHTNGLAGDKQHRKKPETRTLGCGGERRDKRSRCPENKGKSISRREQTAVTDAQDSAERTKNAH